MKLVRNSGPIQLGVISDGPDLPAWLVSEIRAMREAGTVEVTHIVAEDPNPKVAVIGGLAHWIYRRVARRRNYGLSALDAAVLSPATDISVETIGLENILARCTPVFDLILCLSEIICTEDVKSLAQTGVLQFEFGAGEYRHFDWYAAGLKEFLDREGCARSALVFEPKDSADFRVVVQSYSSVHRFSFERTRNEMLWKSGTFLKRALERQALSAPDTGQQGLGSERAPVNAARRCAPPPWTRNSVMLKGWAYYLIERLRVRRYRRRFVERWILTYKSAPFATDFENFEKILPPAGYFWADPCLVQHDDQLYVFFEEADIATGKGHIAVATLNSNGRMVDNRTIISDRHHLSYPIVFRWNDRYYLVPESGENGRIDLYVCDQFPYEWRFCSTLINNIKGYDATFLEFDGRWWMFVNVQSVEGASTWDELHIFFSDSPVSDTWTAHSQNPVVSDVRSARPAGPVFQREGKFIRPSQNCASRYGYGLNFFEIETLTPECYEERLIERIVPAENSGSLAIHHYSSVGNVTFSDSIEPILRS